MPTTRLSPHFALEELCVTLHRDIDNTPPPEVVQTLRITASHMEAVRTLLGDKIITVSSGFRCMALNRAVGGSSVSAHMYGWAVDFNCFGYGSPLEVCRALADKPHLLVFDQLIEEGTWTHISFDPQMRRQVLTRNPAGGYFRGLPPA